MILNSNLNVETSGLLVKYQEYESQSYGLLNMNCFETIKPEIRDVETPKTSVSNCQNVSFANVNWNQKVSHDFDSSLEIHKEDYCLCNSKSHKRQNSQLNQGFSFKNANMVRIIFYKLIQKSLLVLLSLGTVIKQRLILFVNLYFIHIIK